MKTECILAPQKQKLEIVVKEKQMLKSLLTQEQIGEVESGKLVATLSTGQKVKLDDEVKGTVLMLTPLCGG
jgi:hypothetical protein